MESGNLDLIITLVSIIGAVLTAFGFLHRELRRLDSKVDQKFQHVDQKFQHMDRKFKHMDQKFERLGAVLTSVQVSVARIEGHLGIGFPARGGQRADDEPPERAA